MNSYCEGVERTKICRIVQTNITSLKGQLPFPVPSEPSDRVAKLTNQLKAGVRVSLDMTTLTIMRILPREVDPMVRQLSITF